MFKKVFVPAMALTLTMISSNAVADWITSGKSKSQPPTSATLPPVVPAPAVVPPPSVAQVNGAYQCPVVGSSNSSSISGMYSPMQIETGSVGISGIIFVDYDDPGNESMLAKYPSLNADMGGQAGQHYKGIFKINYDYEAKECRRQIIISNKNGSGSWSGYTAVEICDPQLISLFENAKDNGKASSINDVADFAAANGISLEKLRTSSPNVKYFKDENGSVLPRFAVKLESISYTEPTAGRCLMHIRHALGYAGLLQSYNWELSTNPTQANGTLWYWDDRNNPPVSTQY